jgi:hypothetical protein
MGNTDIEKAKWRGWREWESKFKPIENHFAKLEGETTFETYGLEAEFVLTQENKYVWTWIAGDLSDLIVPGFHRKSRLGYYITEVPWESEEDYALLSVEVECECYNEDGYEDGEMGKADCSECEGYGLVTKYVD